jgi:hypothetical protein
MIDTDNLKKNIIKKDEPVFFCIAVSTIKLCETKHIKARMVISRNDKGRVEIIAIGPYKGKKILEIKTIAASPGSPRIENTGFKKLAKMEIMPQY